MEEVHCWPLLVFLSKQTVLHNHRVSAINVSHMIFCLFRPYCFSHHIINRGGLRGATGSCFYYFECSRMETISYRKYLIVGALLPTMWDKVVCRAGHKDDYVVCEKTCEISLFLELLAFPCVIINNNDCHSATGSHYSG